MRNSVHVGREGGEDRNKCAYFRTEIRFVCNMFALSVRRVYINNGTCKHYGNVEVYMSVYVNLYRLSVCACMREGVLPGGRWALWC